MRRLKLIMAAVCFIGVSLSMPFEAFPALSLSEGLKDLTDQTISSMTQKNKGKLAIMDFVNLDGSTDNFCRYLSESLITKIYLTKKFEVIERRLLSKVLEEAQLSMSGIIDTTTAQKLGNILGIDAICVGSVSDLGNIVEVNSRLFETKTGKIFAVASTLFQKDEMVASLMGQASKKPKRVSKSTDKAHSTVTQDMEIPEGFDYLVVDTNDIATPINKLVRHYYEFRSWKPGIHHTYSHFSLFLTEKSQVKVEFNTLGAGYGVGPR